MPATTTEDTAPAAPADQDASEPAPATTPLITADLLVEDVSIDGMCGVY
jgi:mycofactocin precursor